jgi:hypothetical protein
MRGIESFWEAPPELPFSFVYGTTCVFQLT